MLLAAATGLRISELRALKYENIDFLNKCASIETQLGRTKDADPDKKLPLHAIPGKEAEKR